MQLPVIQVREDPEVQLREGLDMDRVQAMVEFEAEGGHLPPIVVVGDDNLLADGHHRLNAARRSGKLNIEADRIPGGKPEAVAAAIQFNDIATTLPLKRTERNAGIKQLLQADWSQERIARPPASTRRPLGYPNALAMRGELTKGPAAGGAAGGRTPKPVTRLPKAIHEKLNDTTLVRIADSVPLAQQEEFAAAVAAAELSEPRVREAIKELRTGASPTAAVESVTPQGREAPRSIAEVAKQARRRLERFLTEPMTVEGTDRDFWAVLEVLAANADMIPLEARGLATLLADVSVRAEAYSSRLRSERAEVTA